MTLPRATRFAGIDLIRVGAGLTLLIVHSAFWLAPLHWPYAIWQALAYFGVEVFLVSLGFLLATCWLDDPTTSLWRGIVRRVMRLWPLYALAVLVNLLFVGMLKVPAPDLPSYLTLTQNLAWRHPEFFPEAWIVNAAVVATLVVALACWGLRLCRTLSVGLLLVTAMIVLAHAPRLLANAIADPAWDLGVRKVLMMRLDPALYGVLLALVWRSRWLDRGWMSVSLAALGSVLLLIAAATFTGTGVDGSAFARTGLFSITDLGFALLLPWLCQLQLSATTARRTAMFASMAYVGLLSHMTLLRAGYALGMPITADSLVQGVAMQLAYLCVAVATAWLLWRWLDRPLRRVLGITSPQHSPPVAER